MALTAGQGAGIIGAALNIGSSLYGNYQAARAAKKAKAITEQQIAANKNWYDRRYNEDYLQRADSQRALNYAKKQAADYTKRVRGSAAVTGASDESVALQKAAGTEMIGDVTSNIASQADAYKQGIENKYMAKDTALQQQLQNAEAARAQAITGAMSNVAGVGSAIIGGASAGLFDKYKAAKAGGVAPNLDLTGSDATKDIFTPVKR